MERLFLLSSVRGRELPLRCAAVELVRVGTASGVATVNPLVAFALAP
jgi:hypothetical protein